MVLSEGKGVGAGKQSSMPSSGWPGQTASFSHSHSCPCRQTNSSIPLWALGQSIRSLWGLGSHGPLPAGSGLQVPALAGFGIASGWRRTEREEGSARFRKIEADVVCQASLRHQNTTPEPSFKSPARLQRLLPHAAPPPPRRKAALPGGRPPPQIQTSI